MNNDFALQNLVDAKRILNNLGIKFWLEAGTCLGAIRDKGFISYDKDMDIGVYAEDLNSVEAFLNLTKHFIDGGFSLAHTFGTIENGFEISFHKRGIKLDVFWFYKKDHFRWHSAWMGRGYNLTDQLFYRYRADLVEELRMIDFLGHKMPIPKNFNEYLTTKYGNWHIKVKDWDWAKSPLNRVEYV